MKATSMFIAAQFTIARLWNQHRCPSTDEWIKKMWYIYTMEYYSALKKNEIIVFAGKWMELENIMQSQISQSPKNKSQMFSLICGSRIFTSVRTLAQECHMLCMLNGITKSVVWSHPHFPLVWAAEGHVSLISTLALKSLSSHAVHTSIELNL